MNADAIPLSTEIYQLCAASALISSLLLERQSLVIASERGTLKLQRPTWRRIACTWLAQQRHEHATTHYCHKYMSAYMMVPT